jgi:hypothetical protein
MYAQQRVTTFLQEQIAIVVKFALQHRVITIYQYNVIQKCLIYEKYIEEAITSQNAQFAC